MNTQQETQLLESVKDSLHLPILTSTSLEKLFEEFQNTN